MPRNIPQPKFPELRDRDWLVERYVTRGMGPTAIARELGCSEASVTNAINRAGIELRHGRRKYVRTWDPTREELLEAYAKAKSLKRLGEAKGLSVSTMRNIFHRAGIRPADFESPRSGTGRRKYPQLLDREWLGEQLATRSIDDIATDLGCPVRAVHRAAAEHALPLPHRGAPASTRQEAVRLYVEEGRLVREIAEALGYEHTTVYKWLQRAGVATGRNRPERRLTEAELEARVEQERARAAKLARTARSRRNAAAAKAAREALSARPMASIAPAARDDTAVIAIRISEATRARRERRHGPFKVAPDGFTNYCPGCALECGPYVCCLDCWGRPPSQLQLPGCEKKVAWQRRLRQGVSGAEFAAIAEALQSWLEEHQVQRV